MSLTQIILESVTKKNKRKYKCPFCDARLDRVELINHIEDNHDEQITDEMPADRIVFNMINKKTHGSCLVDQKETKWNSSLGRYESFCCPECRKRAGEIARENCKKKLGKTPKELLDDPEHQKKMLANRGISGTYKFKNDGGLVSYTASYELKLLKHIDTIGIKSTEVVSPGPIIEYEYKGKKHVWITDQYFPAYNLVLDVKDGGSNPNTRDMPEYREKQLAKEKAIREQKQYNYLRLTDNDFSQLWSAFAEIKMMYMNLTDSKEPIIRINESNEIHITGNILNECANITSNNPLSDIINGDEFYVIAYFENCIDESQQLAYAISSNNRLDTLIGIKDGMINLIEYQDICENPVYTFKFTKPENYSINEHGTNILEIFCGKRLLSDDQILYDKDFKRVLSEQELLKIEESCLTATLLYHEPSLPVITESCLNDEVLSYYKNNKGYFAKNENTGIRTRYYDKLSDIDSNTINFIKSGTL